jgi:hypothetical protein
LDGEFARREKNSIGSNIFAALSFSSNLFIIIIISIDMKKSNEIFSFDAVLLVFEI